MIEHMEYCVACKHAGQVVDHGLETFSIHCEVKDDTCEVEYSDFITSTVVSRYAEPCDDFVRRF